MLNKTHGETLGKIKTKTLKLNQFINAYLTLKVISDLEKK